VEEDTHLVTTVNGKPTAKIMFFNGLCRTTASGDLTSLTNPYLQDNLAFSLQMQLAAAEKYPGLTRKIYLKGYRYNMHYCPKSLLVEVGAQNNTFEEGMNAMEPLAELLAEVLESK
jgi:stage II sporulation protein P